MSKLRIKGSSYPIPKDTIKDARVLHVGLDSRSINEAHWQGLSAAAKIFYLHLKNEYRPYKNGKIALPYSKMKNVKGCSAKPTIAKAIKELRSKGWIKVKEIGGLYRHYNLYRLTFKHEYYNHDKK